MMMMMMMMMMSVSISWDGGQNAWNILKLAHWCNFYPKRHPRESMGSSLSGPDSSCCWCSPKATRRNNDPWLRSWDHGRFHGWIAVHGGKLSKNSWKIGISNHLLLIRTLNYGSLRPPLSQCISFYRSICHNAILYAQICTSTWYLLCTGPDSSCIILD